MRKLFVTAAALSMAAVAGAATAEAGSYTGNWMVTVTKARYSNGTYCLTVNDDGSLGWPHSGEATLPGSEGGTFQVINGFFVATMPFGSGTGEVSNTIFTGLAMNGSIGPGDYEIAYGGEFDSGVNKFKKNGC